MLSFYFYYSFPFSFIFCSLYFVLFFISWKLVSYSISQDNKIIFLQFKTRPAAEDALLIILKTFYIIGTCSVTPKQEEKIKNIKIPESFIEIFKGTIIQEVLWTDVWLDDNVLPFTYRIENKAVEYNEIKKDVLFTIRNAAEDCLPKEDQENSKENYRKKYKENKNKNKNEKEEEEKVEDYRMLNEDEVSKTSLYTNDIFIPHSKYAQNCGYVMFPRSRYKEVMKVF